jgi:phage shock protein PspC (stress-responsive transcriptional regulator)
MNGVEDEDLRGGDQPGKAATSDAPPVDDATPAATDHQPALEPGGVDERRRLYREPEEKKLAGVCGGVADYLGVDPTIVRLALVVLVLSTRAAVVLYLIAAIVMPERPPTVPRWRADRQLVPASYTPHLAFGLLIGAFVLLADDRWWFEAPVIGMALIGLGVWFLVRDRDDSSQSERPASFHEKDIYRENLNAGSDASTTVLGEVAPERAHAGPPASEDTFGSAADKTDEEAQPVPVPPDLLPSVPDDSAHRAGPQGEVPPPVPPWGLGTLSAPGPHPVPRPPVVSRGLVILLGVLLVAGGACASFALFDVFDISIETALSGALVILGLGLVVGTWVGRARGLIAVGLPIAGLLLLADAGDFPLGAGTGDRIVVVDERADLDQSYELLAGKLVLDLRDLPLATGGSDGGQIPSVDVEVFVGEIEVVVPEDATAHVDALVHAGEIESPVGDEEGGPHTHRELELEGRPGAGRIDLDLRVAAGKIEVRRG